jgi:hypothetical protein
MLTMLHALLVINDLQMQRGAKNLAGMLRVNCDLYE